jgi:hypothetical protein
MVLVVNNEQQPKPRFAEYNHILRKPIEHENPVIHSVQYLYCRSHPE